MKTITLQVIEPGTQTIRDHEILVAHIVGWHTREGETTLVLTSAGLLYEIAESIENFRERLRLVIDNLVLKDRGPKKPQARRSIIKKRTVKTREITAATRKPLEEQRSLDPEF